MPFGEVQKLKKAEERAGRWGEGGWINSGSGL